MSIGNTLRRFFKPTQEEKADKLKERILNMYGQTADRRYYLGQLFAMGPEYAPSRLILRFTAQCENSTVDGEEKALTRDLMIDLGEASIVVLKQFLSTRDKGFNWPYRTLAELISRDELIDFLLGLLQDIGPDYVRDTERKEQLMLAIKSFENERLGTAMLPYLGDDNETIRFLAADTAIAMGQKNGIQALAERISLESSQRVLTLILEAFRDKAWTIDESIRAQVTESLPPNFRLNNKGVIV